MNNNNKNDLNESKNVKNSSKLNGLQKNLFTSSLLNSLLSKTSKTLNNSFSHKQSIQRPNLRYDMWSRKTKGFHNKKNLEKISKGAHMVVIKRILELKKVEIIDTKSEKFIWLDLIMEYAFAA